MPLWRLVIRVQASHLSVERADVNVTPAGRLPTGAGHPAGPPRDTATGRIQRVFSPSSGSLARAGLLPIDGEGSAPAVQFAFRRPSAMAVFQFRVSTTGWVRGRKTKKRGNPPGHPHQTPAETSALVAPQSVFMCFPSFHVSVPLIISLPIALCPPSVFLDLWSVSC